jgi:hypothetical protein
LASELCGHVRELLASPHGNYVVQKVVAELPNSVSGFVAAELIGRGAATARHRFGCRAICRLLEHCWGDKRTQALVEEILAESEELSYHNFGHFVMESVIEHGDDKHRARLAAALRRQPGNVAAGARNRNMSYVIEKALTYCEEEDRLAIAKDLLRADSENSITALAKNQFGGYVVRALLRQPGVVASVVLGQLARDAGEVRETKHGQRLLTEVGLHSTSASGGA